MAWSLLKSCPLCGRGSGLGKETSLQNGERSSRQKAQKGCFLKQIAKRIQSGYARHQLPLQFPRAFAVPTYSLGAAAKAISLSREDRQLAALAPASAPTPARVFRSHVLTWGGRRTILLPIGRTAYRADGEGNREDGQLSAPVPASAPISAHVIGPADPLRAKTVADMLPVRVRRSSGRETESGNREGGQLQSCPPS